MIRPPPRSPPFPYPTLSRPQVPAVRLDRLLEALHGREQVHEIFGALGPCDGDAAAPEPSPHFRRRRCALFELFVPVHADTPRLNTPQNRRPDSSTATAPPAPPRRPPDDCWPARACWRGGWESCRSTTERRTPGRCADGPTAPPS